MIDPKEIEKEIKSSIQLKINSLIKDDHILALISQTIDSVVAERIQSIISSHLNNLIQKGKLDKELDLKYQERIAATIQQEIKHKAAHEISRIDVPTEFGKQLNELVNSKLKLAALPSKAIHHSNINWDGFYLTANAISEGTIKNFVSSGIQDVSQDIELTVADNLVVVENNLITRNAEIKEQLTTHFIVTNDLKINNALILNENVNKQFVSLIKDTLSKELKSNKVDIVENPILANGKEILTENSLGPSIVSSNLRKLGRLSELNVSGIAQFNDTLVVTNTGKVGINTPEPDGALTIWDEDSELTIRKHKKKNMYVGTMRDTDLSFGTNGDVKLALRKDGTVELNQLEINGIKISVSNQIPTHNGKPGELVLMNNASEDEPWAYRCIGADRWKAIK